MILVLKPENCITSIHKLDTVSLEKILKFLSSNMSSKWVNNSRFVWKLEIQKSSISINFEVLFDKFLSPWLLRIITLRNKYIFLLNYFNENESIFHAEFDDDVLFFLLVRVIK